MERNIQKNGLTNLLLLLVVGIAALSVALYTKSVGGQIATGFLGMGVQPPMTSLGLMLGSGRRFLLTAWWISVLPGAVIFLTTLSISLVGDWLRDRLDPTLR